MKKILPVLCVLLINFLHAQTTFSCTSAGTACPCTYGTSFAEFYNGYHGDNQNYFSTQPVGLSRYDATINYYADNIWGNIVPPATGSNANPETYSTRWSGRIYLASGSYTFWLTSDDGAYFWLGGNALVVNPTTATAFINNGGLHSPAVVSAVGNFTSNCLQDFKVHFGEQGGNNQCVLEYACASLGISRQFIPASAFCPCMSISNLPVTLTDFYGTANKENVMLYWSTASEKNSLRFTVYKSGDGITWTPLGEKDAAGTSLEPKHYSLADNAPLPGINYYYLSQQDIDGTIKKFDIITVDFSNSAVYIKLYPNPAKDKINITSTTEWKNSDVITVYDALGLPLTIHAEKRNKHTLELTTSDLLPGNYVVKIQSSYQVITKRFVKE